MSELLKEIRQILENKLEESMMPDDACWSDEEVETFLQEFEDEIQPILQKVIGG